MAEEKTSCVLRLFGAPQGQLAGAVGQFAPQWKTQAQWKSRGGETLLALQAASPSGLKKAAQSLQAQFEADLYGAGDTSLAAAVVNALETHDRLLVCSDAAAGALLEARLETVPGAEKVFDFGALSYAHPKAGPQIEKRARARFKAEEPDAVRLALARAQAARRVVVYGDNVIEKHGINRDSTGDREKTRYLCGKQGIFTRDRALIRPGFIRQLETRASTRSASFFHALGSPGRPHNGGGEAGAYRTRNGAKPLKQGHLRAKRGPLGPSRKSQQQTKRTGFAAHGHSIAETAPEGKRASCANGALIRA